MKGELKLIDGTTIYFHADTYLQGQNQFGVIIFSRNETGSRVTTYPWSQVVHVIQERVKP